MRNIADEAKALSQPPANQADFESWLTCSDALTFMKENAESNEIVLYASFLHAFVHSVAVPASRLEKPDISDLLNWSFNATGAWSTWFTFGEPPTVGVEPPPGSTGSKTLEGCDQLVFSRFFEGRVSEKTYHEISQKLTQLLDLHLIVERSAYCRLDDRGDLVDGIRIVRTKSPVSGHLDTVILIHRALLDRYLAVTDSVLVQTFDFTRWRSGFFGGWKHEIDPTTMADGDLAYRIVIEPGNAGCARGVQIVRGRQSKEQVIAEDHPLSREDRQYASFIAYDWKNDVVSEVSCSPKATANYFTRSDLPFDTSPAFFRPDVLLKYKSDREKYALRDRTISCRGAWNLTTYDINEEGQVHTYLCYLRNLPYEEQLYWKAHNEKPKAAISKRAFTTDFAGEWDLEEDTLSALKRRLGTWAEREVPFWKLRSASLPEQVHYPVTTSADEWADELLHLDQLVVEGFETKWLRDRATGLGQKTEVAWGSLKLIDACLVGLGFEQEAAAKVTSPLKTLHHYRSKLKGHASGDEAGAIKQSVLTEHRTYAKHFRALVADVQASLAMIEEALGLPNATNA